MKTITFRISGKFIFYAGTIQIGNTKDGGFEI